MQTGVKSRGCENSTAHESPIQSWKRILPSVVSASKSGAVSPICRAICRPPGLTSRAGCSGSAGRGCRGRTGASAPSAGRTSPPRRPARTRSSPSSMRKFTYTLVWWGSSADQKSRTHSRSSSKPSAVSVVRVDVEGVARAAAVERGVVLAHPRDRPAHLPDREGRQRRVDAQRVVDRDVDHLVASARPRRRSGSSTTGRAGTRDRTSPGGRGTASARTGRAPVSRTALSGRTTSSPSSTGPA